MPAMNIIQRGRIVCLWRRCEPSKLIAETQIIRLSVTRRSNRSIVLFGVGYPSLNQAYLRAVYRHSPPAASGDCASGRIAWPWRGRDPRNLAARSGTSPPFRLARLGVRSDWLERARPYSALSNQPAYASSEVRRTAPT